MNVSSLPQFTYLGDIVQNILYGYILFYKVIFRLFIRLFIRLYFIETLLAQVLPKLILAQQLTSIFILTI